MKALAITTMILTIIFLIALVVVLWVAGYVSGQKKISVSQAEFSELCWKWYQSGCNIAEDGSIKIGSDIASAAKLKKVCNSMYSGNPSETNYDKNAILFCQKICFNACNPVLGG